jgi:hypothetical protein
MEETISLFTSMSITQAAGTQRSWRGFQGWKSCDIKVIHSKVGGVTTQREHLQGFCKTEEAFQAASLPYLVGWDTSTVLSPMEGSCGYSRVPQTRTILPLECGSLGSSSHREYHGGGLLPSSLDKTVQVTTPTLFAKPIFWELRQLSSKEILLAKDLTKVDAAKLAQPSGKSSFLRALTPGKSLVFGSRSLFYGGSASIPTTATITQFARWDEEIGDWNASRGQVIALA